MDKKAVGIVVGGGPAPGINGVIAAATIEAINRGHRVLGISKGFERLAKRDLSCVSDLLIADISRIDSEGGSILGTSRFNPAKSPEHLQTVVEVLKELNIGYLVTIGGDDTASSAGRISEFAGHDIAVGHVPKTIDNDLPLSGLVSTFGFQSARAVGTQIAETLMVDAKTTSRWYFVVAMGRKAGHLALGIGISSGSTLTIIPEEFKEQVPLSTIVDVVVGAILLRMAMGRPYGVIVLAEGLAEKVLEDSFPELRDAERDPHGHIRYAEIDFGSIMRRSVKARLKDLGTSTTIVDKNVGYELRCHMPNAFDREYTRFLGYGVVDFLLNGGTDAMVSREGDSLVAIPFKDIIDPQTGRARVRLVDTESQLYHVMRKYMIRLGPKALDDSELLKRMASFTNRTPEQIDAEFRPTAVEYGW